MSLGERLRKCRENKDLKQLDLSKQLHINNKTLSCYELDKISPDVETLKNLAQFYEVSLPWLLGSNPYHEHIYSDIIERLEKLDKTSVQSVREYIEFLEFKKNK